MGDVFEQALALDQLHHQERLAVERGAAVEEPRDRWVIESGQDLPLAEEALPSCLGRQAAKQLQRHPSIEATVGPLGQIDDAHPACPELAQDGVVPHPGARSSGRASSVTLSSSTVASPPRTAANRRETAPASASIRLRSSDDTNHLMPKRQANVSRRRGVSRSSGLAPLESTAERCCAWAG